MVEIKHIQQINDGFNWKCGAVCLEMIFNHYGIPCNQDDIWNAVQADRSTGPGQKFAFTYSLAQYAISRGLNCTIYKTDENNWPNVLEELEQRSIPAILSVKEKKSGQSHFMIFVGKRDDQFIFSDPNSSNETDGYDYLEVENMWSPHLEIDVTGFIYMIFEGNSIWGGCPYCQRNFPILAQNEAPLSMKIICPYCDRLLFIAQEQ